MHVDGGMVDALDLSSSGLQSLRVQVPFHVTPFLVYYNKKGCKPSHNASMAQMEERSPSKREVAGSRPASSKLSLSYLICYERDKYSSII